MSLLSLLCSAVLTDSNTSPSVPSLSQAGSRQHEADCDGAAGAHEQRVSFGHPALGLASQAVGRGTALQVAPLLGKLPPSRAAAILLIHRAIPLA